MLQNPNTLSKPTRTHHLPQATRRQKQRSYWVKKRWAAWVDDKHPNPAKPGELRWYVNLNDEDTEVAGEHDIRIDETGTET